MSPEFRAVLHQKHLQKLLRQIRLAAIRGQNRIVGFSTACVQFHCRAVMHVCEPGRRTERNAWIGLWLLVRHIATSIQLPRSVRKIITKGSHASLGMHLTPSPELLRKER